MPKSSVSRQGKCSYWLLHRQCRLHAELVFLQIQITASILAGQITGISCGNGLISQCKRENFLWVICSVDCTLTDRLKVRSALNDFSLTASLLVLFEENSTFKSMRTRSSVQLKQCTCSILNLSLRWYRYGRCCLLWLRCVLKYSRQSYTKVEDAVLSLSLTVKPRSARFGRKGNVFVVLLVPGCWQENY